MAKSATQRKQEQREREALAEEERLARLLAYTLKLDVFKGTAQAIDELLPLAELTGEDARHDLLTRLVHGAHRLAQHNPAAFLDLVRL